MDDKELASVGELASPGGRAFRRDVQGLRGVAVVLVVVFHSGVALSGGFVGVDVFFVISGYVITRLLLAELEETGEIGFGRFYARRARRLLPLLALTLAVTSVAGLLFLGPREPARSTSGTAIGAALVNANTVLARQENGYFALDPTKNALLHTWSLSVEEQFYLVFPALLLGGWRLARRRPNRSPRAVLTKVVVGAAVGSAALALALGAGAGGAWIEAAGFHSAASFAFYGAPTRAWEFLAGALVVLLLEPAMSRVTSSASSLAFGVLGAVLIGVAAVGFYGSPEFDVVHAAIPVAGAVLVLLSGVHAADRGLPAMLSWWPMVRLGDVSYAWYLFHWPLIVFAATLWSHPWAGAVASLLALGLAFAAHGVIENRFRFDGRIVGWRAVRVGAACTAMAVVVAGATWAVEPSLPVADGYADVARPNIAKQRRCDGVPWDSVVASDSECTWRVDRPVGHVVVVGDSHAAHLAEPVIEAGTGLGLDTTVTIKTGCPFLDGVDTSDDCRPHHEATMAGILRDRPSIVVIAGASALAIEEVELTFDDGAPVLDPAAKAQRWRVALAATIRRLQAAGIRVVLVHDIPYFVAEPLLCGRLRAFVDKCETTADPGYELAYRRRAFDAEVDVVASLPGVVTVDPFPLLCSEQWCGNVVDGNWLYTDKHHLSIHGANRLGTLFVAALTPLVPDDTTGQRPPEPA